jgi:hypothetical protein
VHIIDQLETKEWFEKAAEKNSLLVGMNKIVSIPQQETNGPKQYKHIKEKLKYGRSYRDVSEKCKTRNSNYPYSRNINILALTIGEQINFNAKFCCYKCAVIDAKRRPPG